jgi:hypothetical protein
MNIRDYVKAGLHYKHTSIGHPAWNSNPESYATVMEVINMGAKTAIEMAQKADLTEGQIQAILWRMKKRGMVELVHYWELLRPVPNNKKDTEWGAVEKLLRRKPRGSRDLREIIGCDLTHMDHILQRMRRAGCVRLVHYWKVIG